MFNDGDFEARAATGELRPVVATDRHPSAPKAHVPYCTRSQIVLYLDPAGAEVAAVHRYLKPDGTLGGSGRPDPKRLLKDGVLYVAWWEPRAGGR